MLNRILQLMNDRKINAKQLTSELGLSHGVISDWKKGKAKPSTDAIMKLSKYFDVSTDYILFGTSSYKEDNNTADVCSENSDFKKITINENNLQYFFKLLNVEQKNKILGRMEAYIEENNEKEFKTKEAPEEYISSNLKIVPLLTSDDEGFNKALNKKSKSKKIVPILGTTAAGQPMEIIENILDTLSVPDDKIDFALNVKGNSMSPLIMPGDYIFINKDSTIENGNIVVISIDETVTCKKYYVHKEYIELKSINTDYDPIIINSNTDKNLRIIGKVVYGQRNGIFFGVN